MMNIAAPISQKAKWRNILQQQKLANAKRWLQILESCPDPISLVHEDYDNFLRALETTLQTSKTFDIAYELSQILFPIIFGYADWDRWLVYLQQIHHTSKNLHRQVEEARLLEQIGDIQYHQGNLNDAEINYYAASHLYNQQGNLSSYSRTLAMQASLKDIQGEPEKAISLCQQALATAKQAKDKYALANANLNLSNIYRRNRNWAQALKAAQTAYVLYHELGYSTLFTKASITLIAIWAEYGNWEEINQLSDELMSVLNVSGDVHNLSQLKNNMGIFAFSQGNFILAEAAWQEALQMNSQIQDPMELSSIYNNLGMVYTQMEEWETAEEMLLKAVTGYRRFGD
ncbi:tetratricopeptide repeat protein, partial [Candidatus Saccharibacteria bacterium]|nr:tetratricopeptide repeat protein [Candidatus Saccharibacteria bacterium]